MEKKISKFRHVKCSVVNKVTCNDKHTTVFVFEHANKCCKRKREGDYLRGTTDYQYFMGCILAAALNTNHDNVIINRGAKGKPYLLCPLTADLHFNYSYSKSLFAVAISNGYSLGIDVQKCLDGYSRNFVNKVFCRNELDLLNTSNIYNFDQLVTRLWSRKEAALKAIGIGITVKLSIVDASFRKANGVFIYFNRGTIFLPTIDIYAGPSYTCSLSFYKPQVVQPDEKILSLLKTESSSGSERSLTDDQYATSSKEIFGEL